MTISLVRLRLLPAGRLLVGGAGFSLLALTLLGLLQETILARGAWLAKLTGPSPVEPLPKPDPYQVGPTPPRRPYAIGPSVQPVDAPAQRITRTATSKPLSEQDVRRAKLQSAVRQAQLTLMNLRSESDDLVRRLRRLRRDADDYFKGMSPDDPDSRVWTAVRDFPGVNQHLLNNAESAVESAKTDDDSRSLSANPEPKLPASETISKTQAWADSEREHIHELAKKLDHIVSRIGTTERQQP